MNKINKTEVQEYSVKKKNTDFQMLFHPQVDVEGTGHKGHTNQIKDLM